jgi:hypothetical protein
MLEQNAMRIASTLLGNNTDGDKRSIEKRDFCSSPCYPRN